MLEKYKIIKIINNSFPLLLIILLSFFSCKSSEENDSFELGEKLFGRIDPHLGYAHDLNFSSRKSNSIPILGFDSIHLEKREDGFAVLKYISTNKPIKIAIIGASNSDPYLFSGNWPYQLHLALKNIHKSHIIHNGAVSGYNSTQSLIKLIRDVFVLDKMDYVIFMGPGNDSFEISGDNLKDHCSVHPVSDYFSRKINESRNFNQNKILLFFKKLLNADRESNPIQLGVKSSDCTKNAIMNIKYMNAISKLNHSKFIHLLDPISKNDSQVEKSKWFLQIPPEKRPVFEKFFRDVYNGLIEHKITYRFEDLPGDQVVFSNQAHLNVKGNEIISKSILKIILDLEMQNAISK